MEDRAELLELLKRRAEDVAARWCDTVLATYPERAYEAWTRETDPFANPVGHSLRVGTRAILDAVLEHARRGAATPPGDGGDGIHEAVADIVRIRAVQQMLPSAAVGFVFQLKDAVREVLASELRDPRLAADLTELDQSIDAAALVTFDAYTQQRERLVELRINELKKNIPWFVGRAGQAEVERTLK